MPQERLLVVLTKGEDGYIVARIPELPGCVSQGRTRREALKHVKEAALLCIESAQEEGWIPPESVIHRSQISLKHEDGIDAVKVAA